MIGGIICIVGFFLIALGAGHKVKNGELEGVGWISLILGFIAVIVGGALAFYL